MIQYTDDPVADADARDRYLDSLLENLPKCKVCKERIQDRHYYEFGYHNVCPDCLETYCDRLYRVENDALDG